MTLELSLSRKQVRLLLCYKQNKPQSHHYANQRRKEQFSCVKERTVLQAKSWKKSQKFEKESLALPAVSSTVLWRPLNREGLWLGQLGKVVQVLILGGSRWVIPELQLQGVLGHLD